MKEMNFNDLKKKIEQSRPLVTKKLISNRQDRLVRRRPRSEEEKEVLAKICVNKWSSAIKNGKIKKISKKEWIYDLRN